jgi:murein L,D-transpeptidase YcbB/YkuD
MNYQKAEQELMKKASVIDTWIIPYEDDDAAAAATTKAEADAAAAAAAAGDKLFDQEAVNKLLAEERRKYQTQQQNMLNELKALKTKSRLTDEERRELDGRLEKMQAEFMTKEELAKREREKEEKKYKSDLEKLSNDVQKWQGLFTETSIKTAITGSAIKNKAYNPAQVIAILRPSTALEEAVDGEGNPTG